MMARSTVTNAWTAILLARVALIASVAIVANPIAAAAQTSTREGKIGAFFPYGLDAQLLRLDKIERIARIDARPYVRTVDPGDGRVGYLILTLTVKNRAATPAYVPTLVTTIATDTGPAVNPAVYGPFVGTSTRQADSQTTIPAHATATLHLAVIDIPNGHRVTELILSPNDATPQYRFRLKAAEVSTLPVIPRSGKF